MSAQTGCTWLCKFIFRRQAGQHIVIFGPNILIGWTFYGPTPSTDDINIRNAWIRCFHSNQSINKRTIRIRALQMTENSVCTLRPSDVLQNGAMLIQRDREETNCWIHVFVYFLCVQKVFSSLHKIHIEPLMTDGTIQTICFYTFLCLNSVIYLAVNGTVTSLPVFIQNILNCFPRTNKDLWVWNDMGVSD